MPLVIPYRRAAAVAYAHRWAFGRNPQFYDYEEIGGDCTNFASQCLYAGSGIMNYTPIFGWYYISANDKAPAWTGVEYFRNFLLRDEISPGPFAEEVGLKELLPGDFVQFNFKGEVFSHTPIVVSVGTPPRPGNILLAAHSYDADYRPLDSYVYQEIRYLHILGSYARDTAIRERPQSPQEAPESQQSQPSSP